MFHSIASGGRHTFSYADRLLGMYQRYRLLARPLPQLGHFGHRIELDSVKHPEWNALDKRLRECIPMLERLSITDAHRYGVSHETHLSPGGWEGLRSPQQCDQGLGSLASFAFLRELTVTEHALFGYSPTALNSDRVIPPPRSLSTVPPRRALLPSSLKSLEIHADKVHTCRSRIDRLYTEIVGACPEDLTFVTSSDQRWWTKLGSEPWRMYERSSQEV